METNNHLLSVSVNKTNTSKTVSNKVRQTKIQSHPVFDLFAKVFDYGTWDDNYSTFGDKYDTVMLLSISIVTGDL